MAKLIINISGKEQSHYLYRRFTSIGKTGDIEIDLPQIPSVIAYLTQSNNAFTLVLPKNNDPIKIGNNLVRNHALKNGDKFFIKNIEFCFIADDEVIPDILKDKETLIAYRHLLNFSLRIAQETDINKLLKIMLKEIIYIINAEYGFLVLLENNKPQIKAEQYALNNDYTSDTLSDSIINKVIKTKEAIIISDALNHQEFSSSQSVVNFRLSSVMCAPLIYQQQLLGAIYVGNNSFVNAFGENSLEILTIYASQAALLVKNALHIDALKHQTKNLEESLEMAKFGGIIGSCNSMQKIFERITKIAQTDIGVVISGEPGTGKELIAKELHARSSRKNGPLAIINCGTIPEHLLERELFGYVRGAFEGAHQTSIGKIQSAKMGTLFVDEIEEMTISLQEQLVRAILQQKACKVGDNKYEDINIRLVVATTKNLKELIKIKKLKEDFYSILNIMEISLPALRDRGNDVLVLANFFLQKYAKIYGKVILGFEDEVKNALLSFDWPGNVRQLENVIKRGTVMCEAKRLVIKDLDIDIQNNQKNLSLTDAIDRFRKRYIYESLERNNGNRTKTAQELGVDPRTIFRHIENEKNIY